MRQTLIVTATVTATLFSTACMRSMSSSTFRPDGTSVSVLFVLPSEQERYSRSQVYDDTRLVADYSYQGYSGPNYEYEETTGVPSAYHVALWGGPYDGTDVTTAQTILSPGSYKFAYFDQPNDTAMQGWLNVRNTGSDLASVLAKWRDSITQQKQRLAYDLEIDGSMDLKTRDIYKDYGEKMDAYDPLEHRSPPEVFKSFKKQMQAYNKLERQLQKTIRAESRVQQARYREMDDLFRYADVVIMPGEDSFFAPTTQPTFSKDDLRAVRNGNPVSKLVLAADYEEARWKLDQVNRLYDDLSRFQEVMRQEAERLERRKSLLCLTDHLYHHDKRFVENEILLQYTLGLIDRFNDHASDLRERRMGLAFAMSLFTSDTNFTALDQEERDLLDERTVLEREHQRLDCLFDETGETSARRVVIERNRQDVSSNIDTINYQIEQIQQARTTLATMLGWTDVIHRHNDMQLLTTTFVADQLPPAVRRVVEREAMMTVRLEKTDKVFAPRPTSVASARTRPAWMYAAEPTWAPRAETEPREATLASHSEDAADWQRDDMRSPQDEPNKRCNWFKRLICPPCWFGHSTCTEYPSEQR
ncbi:MAG: hypothetical protein JSU63_05440 [Phycisphaerales bacterium]|nr:MAG: hypothetical protein JSU63_05440 [Phycisphaerales bacterium]